jgi:ferritin-like metal-binding protein YciE
LAAAPRTLKELYTADMRDLWSSNDQMRAVVQSFAEKATSPRIRQLFEQSVSGIEKHTQTLRELAGASDSSPCPGMQGLVSEAKKHALESDLPAELRDLEMIAQYQRMSHYGLAGFGTVAAYAEALGMSQEAGKLKAMVSEIYKGDEFSSSLAESAQKSVAQ